MNKSCLKIFIFLIITIVMVCICPFVGQHKIDISAVFEKGSIDSQIFFNLRLPRVLLGLLAGGSLAMIGAAFQVILRNPLATPYTLGITGGAAVGAYLAIAFPAMFFQIGPFSSVQILALAAAGLTQFAIYAAARRSLGMSMNTLLLAGVTFGIFCGSLVLLLRYIAQPKMLVSMDRWMMGGLDTVGYSSVIAVSCFVLPAVVVMVANSVSLNHLSLGDDMAAGHGVDVQRVQLVCFSAAAFATAGVVSAVGPIGFVGLIVPHAVRRICGNDCRVVLVNSFLAGSALLVCCDAAARTVFAPTEMPVGIVTAMIGGPVFIAMLLMGRWK